MADRRKEQNKRVQQKFREKRQKELDDLRSSFSSMKDEMSKLQSALEAAQKENTLLKSRLDNQVAFSTRAQPAVPADGDDQNFLSYLEDEDREFQQLFGETQAGTSQNSARSAVLAGEPSLVLSTPESERLLSKNSLPKGKDDVTLKLLQVENSQQEMDDVRASNDLQQGLGASPISSHLIPQQSQNQDHEMVYGSDTNFESVAPATQDGSHMFNHSKSFYGSVDLSSTYNLPLSHQHNNALTSDLGGLWPSNLATGAEGAVMQSSDGERLMGLFSQLLALEHARLSARTQFQPAY
ncbi:hypothetical protein B0J12DRAFT_747048 [Macrophomina phaseolina]|uniref:BZIP domain-containing protein n=1 Tax=Macrophomina phaseolina TaxID=35725 RepID=A0ABQ8FQW9_9PEZI|nr:hypothetical protein B0J12DRAFT_747048 [Macrophomina phaseolina]